MYCRTCGSKVEEKDQYCSNCGNKPNKGNKFCHNCGSKTNQQQEICLECGVKFQEKSVNFNNVSTKRNKIHCWNCGTATNPEQEICTNCGVYLENVLNGRVVSSEQPERKKSKLALVSLVVSILYFLFIIGGFFYMILTEYNYIPLHFIIEGIIEIFLPHLVFIILATVMNGIGYFFYSKWLVLTGAVLYTLALIVYPLNIIGTIVPAILSYISFGQTKMAEDKAYQEHDTWKQ